ncbi:periplasmic binding protein-like II, partial [Aureobasidium melanogenum]
MKISQLVAMLALSAPVLSATLHQPDRFQSKDVIVEKRTLDQIYAAAMNETGELIVLWGGDAVKQGDATIAAWRAKFPDIKLKLTVDVSKYHDSRVDRNYQRNGDDGADIAVLQTLHDFGRWKRQDRLTLYKPLEWDNIYSAIKDPDGAFLGTYIYQFGNFIYNKHALNAILAIPNDDDAIAYLFSVIIEKRGWDWFDALQKQNVQWIRGTGEPADFLAAENTTRALSFTTNLNGNSALASKTPSETRFLWPQTAVIFATTPRPESSKLFMSWLISDEYQQQFVDGGYYLARKDLHGELESVWDDELTPLTQFATFMENRDVVEWWRLQFETSLGTAQGVSPVLSEFGRQSSL